MRLNSNNNLCWRSTEEIKWRERGGERSMGRASRGNAGCGVSLSGSSLSLLGRLCAHCWGLPQQDINHSHLPEPIPLVDEFLLLWHPIRQQDWLRKKKIRELMLLTGGGGSLDITPRFQQKLDPRLLGLSALPTRRFSQKSL
jgi:hypothetical protein